MAEMRVLVGIPCSGKTTLAEHWQTTGEVETIVSPTQIRREYTPFVDDTRVDHHVWDEFYDTLRRLLRDEVSFVIDHENTRKDHRAILVRIAAEYGVTPSAWILGCGIDAALTRNHDLPQRHSFNDMGHRYAEFVAECAPGDLVVEGFDPVVNMPYLSGKERWEHYTATPPAESPTAEPKYAVVAMLPETDDKTRLDFLSKELTSFDDVAHILRGMDANVPGWRAITFVHIEDLPLLQAPAVT